MAKKGQNLQFKASCQVVLTLMAIRNSLWKHYLFHNIVQVNYHMMKIFFCSKNVRFGSWDLRLLGILDYTFHLL